jgi:hypothetical protein
VTSIIRRNGKYNPKLFMLASLFACNKANIFKYRDKISLFQTRVYYNKFNGVVINGGIVRTKVIKVFDPSYQVTHPDLEWNWESTSW